MDGDEQLELKNIDNFICIKVNERVENSANESDNNQCEWRQHARTLMAALTSCLGSVVLGNVFSYTSPAIPNINLNPNRFHLNNVEVAIVVSIVSLGGLTGGALGGICLDRFGRKSTIMYAVLPVAFGWLLIVAAPNVYCLSAGRWLTGFGSGIFDVAVPAYIVEIASTSVRGFIGSCHELLTNIGMLYIFIFGIFLSWTWMAIACLVVPVILMFGMLFVPESPRWLFGKGQIDECIKSLRWFRGSDEVAHNEMSELAVNLQSEKQKTAGWEEFRKPEVYRPLLIIIGLMFFQQMSGYGIIQSYMVTILNAGGTTWDSKAETAVVGAIGVVANMLSASVVDRVGRRVMLIISASFMSLSFAGLSVYFTLLNCNIDVHKYSFFPFACIALYNLSVSLGYGPIPFYIANELLPLRVRGRAVGLAISSVWFFAFFSSLLFPIVVEAIGYYAVFWAITGIGATAVIYAFFLVPETKGLSLEEIERQNASS